MKKYLIFGIFLALLSGIYLVFTSSQRGPIDFNAQIRPIFNGKCISCHGGVKRNGGFSLLFRKDALDLNKSGLPAIVPGKPDSSELLNRLVHSDPELRMPLDGEPLNQEEIELLTRWIAEGAKWEDHWAFVPPDPNLIPPNNDQAGLDAFVSERLQQEDLSLSPTADKTTLIRRVSLDLIGLPPTQEEVENFLNDSSEDAFEKVVDRLLESPHYGEKWAAMWLDLARYADSQGYQKDRYRNIWRYRDWVIHAFNQNMPFDQFTKEQLAGDLLPEPSPDQILATAFHRNTMSNDEGGTDDEEFRVAAVIDRVNTTFEVWQGVTIGCVQCHTHPYDPILHEEFYQVYAFFNNTADTDKTSEKPVLSLLSPAQIKEQQEIKDWLAKQSSEADTAIVSEMEKRLSEIQPGKTPIMVELPPDSSRTTFLFERGNWLVHGEEVSPAVPASLNPFPTNAPKNRLGFAEWLMAPENPLTARVIVNRFWEQLFGMGLVETSEDFGTQGIPPTHQKLLDWLAIQFIHTHNWDVKKLLKQIVMSNTYQQVSSCSASLCENDPDNRLLARGPRIRLSAEQLRDQALAVSGLLSRKMYGPSVMPPQPEGVWQVIRNVLKWRPSEGEDRYRRAIYTFWRRSSPYPSMMAFDTPSREFCLSRRIRTNTPLQALVTLNDSTYMEAAIALANQANQDNFDETNAPIIQAYQLAMMRPPSSEKLTVLSDFYQKTLNHYTKNPQEVEALIPNKEKATPDFAALINTANVILNLDEFIVKE